MRATLLTVAVIITLVTAQRADAQSLFVVQGERAVEGAVGWSVGPFSNGIETSGGVSLDGRWDVGFGVNHYTADLGGDDDTTFIEWTPSVRYFFFKEDDDATPVSVAAHAQFFDDNYEGGADGWYVLAGGQLFKKLTLTSGFALYPFVGFSVAGESYPIGGDDSEHAVYLTRQFGVHGQVALGDNGWLRITAEEHSFRRETYRALRTAFVRRF